MSHRLTLTFVFGLLISGCGGGSGPADAASDTDASVEDDAGLRVCNTWPDCGPCRGDGDCADIVSSLGGGTGSYMCYPPGQGAPGGVAPPRPTLECLETADCTGTDVCASYPTPGNEREASTRCQPPCTADDCGAGDRCGSEGLCEPTPCDEGYACPTHTTCDPAAAGHGCVRDACAQDADCGDTGFCVEGRCYADLGSCQTPGA